MPLPESAGQREYNKFAIMDSGSTAVNVVLCVKMDSGAIYTLLGEDAGAGTAKLQTYDPVREATVSITVAGGTGAAQTNTIINKVEDIVIVPPSEAAQYNIALTEQSTRYPILSASRLWTGTQKIKVDTTAGDGFVSGTITNATINGAYSMKVRHK